MDDVDAVQAQIAKTMLTSGDWVTARLDRVVYLEKAPLIYWLMAILYKIFGVADWVARLPVALASIALALLSASFGMWAFGERAGFYAGLCMSTCVGLFLFTRIQIPDVMLTFREPGCGCGPGLYHGFLWFYFVNEQLLRFLNLRYPRDYNTVPRLYFWLFHLL
jgi:hypothetical protein